MLEVIDIFFAFQIGVASYVICCVLTKQNYILEPYYDFLVWMNKNYRWVAYPLGFCELCFSGQFALWVWTYFNFEATPEGLLKHGVFISFSILFTLCIKTFFKLCK